MNKEQCTVATLKASTQVHMQRPLRNATQCDVVCHRCCCLRCCRCCCLHCCRCCCLHCCHCCCCCYCCCCCCCCRCCCCILLLLLPPLPLLPLLLPLPSPLLLFASAAAIVDGCGSVGAELAVAAEVAVAVRGEEVCRTDGCSDSGGGAAPSCRHAGARRARGVGRGGG